MTEHHSCKRCGSEWANCSCARASNSDKGRYIGNGKWENDSKPAEFSPLQLQVASEIQKDSQHAAVTESAQPADPKALTAGKKLPLLSVMSPAALIHEAVALQYGAFEAPKIDGTFGYGPYNWRSSQPVEAMTYIDACERHLLKWVDGEEYDPDTAPREGDPDYEHHKTGRAHHLGLAKASLGILLDAMEHGNLIDNRPKVRKQVASRLLAALKR